MTALKTTTPLVAFLFVEIWYGHAEGVKRSEASCDASRGLESGRVGEWESGRVGERESGRAGELESWRAGEPPLVPTL
jgi:hypothetical protein